jgi:hypothetical protein
VHVPLTFVHTGTNSPRNGETPHVAASVMPAVEHALVVEQVFPTLVLPHAVTQAVPSTFAPSLSLNFGAKAL